MIRQEMKEPLVTDLLRLLDTAPVLFGLFIWQTVSELLTKSTGDKFFTVRPFIFPFNLNDLTLSVDRTLN